MTPTFPELMDLCDRAIRDDGELHGHERAGTHIGTAATLARALKALLEGEWLGEPNTSTFPFPREGIVCFHCGRRFHTPGAARWHFGVKPNEPGTPKCSAADPYLQTR